ncbi:hypothetical protein BH11ARM1_BH11ARM1_11430 [soil metagenome]
MKRKLSYNWIVKGTVRVHVYGTGSGVRVCLFIYQSAANGMTSTEYTNDQGDAYIEVNTDAGADAEVYVGGQKKTSRASIQDTYYI